MDASARPHANDIFDRVQNDGARELARPFSSLGFSALFAGFTIGATPLAAALVLSQLGTSGAAELAAGLVYPVGYVAVILGRAQFFTENTLYPVVVALQNPSVVPRTIRLWAIVLGGNLIGAVVFGLLMSESPVLEPQAHAALVDAGLQRVADAPWANFWGAFIVGWLLAMVAWLVEASDTAFGRLSVIWALTFVAGIGGFDHCIASTIEVFSATLDGQVEAGRLLGWLGTVVAGNIAGGILIVSVLNYGQIRAERS